MKRREFVKVSAALGSLLVLPSWSVASSQKSPDKVGIILGNVTRLRIGPHATEALREQNRTDRLLGYPESFPYPPDDENNYWAEAIEEGGRYYYRAKGVTVDIAKWEFDRVVRNPNLYYFSTAAKLHQRIRQAKAGGPITI